MRNRLQQTNDGEATDYVSDAADRFLTATDLSDRTTYSYDAAGNQTAIEVPTGDITATIWDLVNAGPAGVGVVVMSNAGRYA